ncbi:hypothetical protein [Candidatus Ichthyocystis sparus]|nr:hypothetical protein [Candidatus Ichthyocystis sparus]
MALQLVAVIKKLMSPTVVEINLPLRQSAGMLDPKNQQKSGDGSSGISLLASSRSVQELGSKPKTRGKVGKGKGHKQEKRLCMEQPCPKIS